MVIKTITVTEDAYQTMKRLKGEHESFSELFRRLGNQQLKVRDIAGALKHSPAEAAAFRKRVQEAHAALGKGLQQRVDDVRTRFKRTH